MAAKVIVAATVAFLVAYWIAQPYVSGDTPFVLDASNALITCLSQHDYDGCGFTGKLNDAGLMSPMADWPLVQHVPDLISIGLGADSHPTRTRVLEVLNIISVVGSIVLAGIVLARARLRPWFWIFVLLVLSSPLIWYARNTSNEALAGGLVMSLVAAALVPAPPFVVGLAAMGASVTKETAYPFVAALGLLGLVLARRRTGQAIRAHVIWGIAGMAVAFVATSLFNIVRYDSIWNKNLLDSTLHTHGLPHELENFAALFVSPSGGLFVFWPAVGVLILAACLLPLARRRQGLDWHPAAVIAAVVVVLAFGFASWWTPFGWSAYGPRFMLPWMIPAALILVVAYAGPLTDLTRRFLAAPWRVGLAFAVVFALALPNIGQMWRPTAIVGFFAQRNPPCTAPWFVGEEKWFACQHKQMWFAQPMPVYALHGLRSAGGIVTTILIGASVLGCLIMFRRETESRSHAASVRREPHMSRDVVVEDVDG